MPVTPTFRTSVTQHVDIWKFWGEPEDVAAFVRPSGGTWHSEFQAMVTPDEFRNGAGLGSAEQLQLAATSLAFAGAMKLLGMGVQQMKQAAHNRTDAQGEGGSAARARGVLRPAPRSASGPRRPSAARAGAAAAAGSGAPGGNSARSTSAARRAQSASECRAAGDLAIVQIAPEAPAVAQQDVLQHPRVMQRHRALRACRRRARSTPPGGRRESSARSSTRR